MENQQKAVPTWYWVIAVLFLLWAVFGILSFFAHATLSDEALGLMTEEQQALHARYPLWTYIVFGTAVFTGLAGSIALLLKKKAARLFFLISVIAVIIQMTHSLFIAGAMEVYGNEAAIFPTVIILVGFFELWFSGFAIRKGWIK